MQRRPGAMRRGRGAAQRGAGGPGRGRALPSVLYAARISPAVKSTDLRGGSRPPLALSSNLIVQCLAARPRRQSTKVQLPASSLSCLKRASRLSTRPCGSPPGFSTVFRFQKFYFVMHPLKLLPDDFNFSFLRGLNEHALSSLGFYCCWVFVFSFFPFFLNWPQDEAALIYSSHDVVTSWAFILGAARSITTHQHPPRHFLPKRLGITGTLVKRMHKGKMCLCYPLFVFKYLLM